MCSAILIFLTLPCIFSNSQMRTRIELLLRQNKLTKDDVKDILEVCALGFDFVRVCRLWCLER